MKKEDFIMMKCVIIYNPNSGKLTNRNDVKKIYKLLDNYGYETEIIYTEYIVHSGIHDEEVLGLAALDEKYAGDQGCALSHERTSRLHVYLLVFAPYDVV